MTATDLLADRAVAAWAMLARTENPMIPGVAVDWLRDECGTDDVSACKLALYGAAADWIHELYATKRGDWEETPRAIEDRVRSGNFHLAGLNGYWPDALSHMFNFERVEKAGQGQWLAWCERAAHALAICRAIESA